MIYKEIILNIRSQNLAGLSESDILILIGKFFEPKFVLNETNIELYNQLIYYFRKDTKFNGDLNKGLLLMGHIGTGKTLAMKIMHVFSVVRSDRRFKYFEADEFIDLYFNEGRSGLYKFEHSHDMLLDELGNDSGKHNSFGNIEDPISLLINRRYNEFTNPQKKLFTHAITNLDEEELNNRFNERIIDRMYEMFNFIPVIGTSWRRMK